MENKRFEVYIAGPLFNPEENLHNKELARMFRDAGYMVFNPIEDGIEGAAQENLQEEELSRRIYELDSTRVRESRIFVANLNGPQVDDGTATEIGIASESQRTKRVHNLKEGVEVLIGYFNDTRSLTHNMRRNPLPMGAFLKAPNILVDTREKALHWALENHPPKKS
jgi:hypothetical protein